MAVFRDSHSSCGMAAHELGCLPQHLRRALILGCWEGRCWNWDFKEPASQNAVNIHAGSALYAAA